MTRFLSFYCQTATLLFGLTIGAIQSLSAQDTIPPVLTCMNGFGISIHSSQSTTLWGADALETVTDNESSFEQLQFSVRESGTGTGFPLDSLGNPVPYLTITCEDAGATALELWGRDAAGNASFCQFIVMVSPLTPEDCPTEWPFLYGHITTAHGGAPMEGVLLIMNGNLGGIPSVAFVTNANGEYQSALPPLATGGTITPSLDEDVLNGVDIWDLVLISRHILNITPLPGPYELIAADANKSGTVTTYDIVELRKLILGTYLTLPELKSWRFIDRTQQFTMDQNPFADEFRENFTWDNPGDFSFIMDGISFRGIKVGDVNGSATLDMQGELDIRVLDPAVFSVQSSVEKGKKGDVIALTITPDQASVGYQLALKTSGLSVLSVSGRAELSDDHIYYGADFVRVVSEAGGFPFTITARMERDGDPNEMVSSDAQAIAPRAYSDMGGPQEIWLIPVPTDIQRAAASFTITPNPMKDQALLTFHQPEPGMVCLKVYDVNGRQVLNREQWVDKGSGSISINAADIGNGKGWFTCMLTSNSGRIQQKMLRW